MHVPDLNNSIMAISLDIYFWLCSRFHFLLRNWSSLLIHVVVFAGPENGYSQEFEQLQDELSRYDDLMANLSDPASTEGKCLLSAFLRMEEIVNTAELDENCLELAKQVSHCKIFVRKLKGRKRRCLAMNCNYNLLWVRKCYFPSLPSFNSL